MDEQLDLFHEKITDDCDSEKIKTKLYNFVRESNNHEFEFQPNQIANGFSYKCYGMIWLWVIKKSNSYTIEFNNTPNDLYDKIVMKFCNSLVLPIIKEGRIIVESKNPLEILDLLKNELIYKYNYLRVHEPVEGFGCCSSYMQCSDIKKCIQSDVKLAKGCTYKKNLDKNIIFYGKNRNVE